MQYIDKLITRTNNDVVREAKAVSKFEQELEILNRTNVTLVGQRLPRWYTYKSVSRQRESLVEHTNHLTELAEVQVELEGEKNSLFEVGERPNLFYHSVNRGNWTQKQDQRP